MCIATQAFARRFRPLRRIGDRTWTFSESALAIPGDRGGKYGLKHSVPEQRKKVWKTGRDRKQTNNGCCAEQTEYDDALAGHR
jgi:hypothetical protein